MLGYDRELNVVARDDTAELVAYAFDKQDNPLTKFDGVGTATDEELTAVVFHVRKPDGTGTDYPGTIEVDDDDVAYGKINYNDTDQVGEYQVLARFSIGTEITKSIRSDFAVADPFEDATVKLNAEQVITALVWQKVEDCFDSTDGGPWLRDMTMEVFQPSELPELFQEALLEINVYNPPTHFGVEQFAQNVEGANAMVTPDHQILVLSVFLGVIRHLMRSYVEQPNPTGGQVTWEDRRDYLQRWGTIYQIEWQRYDSLLKLWKRQFLDLNQGKLLVANKAGRLLPAPLRTRNIGRGYY